MLTPDRRSFDSRRVRIYEAYDYSPNMYVPPNNVFMNCHRCLPRSSSHGRRRQPAAVQVYYRIFRQVTCCNVHHRGDFFSGSYAQLWNYGTARLECL